MTNSWSLFYNSFVKLSLHKTIHYIAIPMDPKHKSYKGAALFGIGHILESFPYFLGRIKKTCV